MVEHADIWNTGKKKTQQPLGLCWDLNMELITVFVQQMQYPRVIFKGGRFLFL